MDMTSIYAVRWAQNIQKWNSIEISLIEIIKYGSKIFTEPDVRQKSKEGLGTKIYASALDNILNAMKGHRIFDRFGFNLPKLNESKGSNYSFVVEYEKWVYVPHLRDWYNSGKNEVLSNYVPPAEISFLLKNCIDKVAT